MSNVTAPIVLIHGLWLSADSWRGWIDRYRAAGHVVHAPDWPADPGIGLAEAADHFDAFVRSLPDAPIIIGHSMGGLITQLLLDRGLGRAGVAIEPSKPRGVLRAPLSMWRSIGRGCAIRATGGSQVRDQPGHTSTTSFANTISRADSDRLHSELAIPAPGSVLFDVAFADLTTEVEGGECCRLRELRPRTAAADRRRP